MLKWIVFVLEFFIPCWALSKNPSLLSGVSMDDVFVCSGKVLYSRSTAVFKKLIGNGIFLIAGNNHENSRLNSRLCVASFSFFPVPCFVSSKLQSNQFWLLTTEYRHSTLVAAGKSKRFTLAVLLIWHWTREIRKRNIHRSGLTSGRGFKTR